MDRIYTGLKKENQIKHFKHRLRERYDIEIGDEEIEYYVGLIQTGHQSQVIHLAKQSKRVSFKLLIIRGKTIPVIYDKKRKTLVTALPADSALVRYYLEEQL